MLRKLLQKRREGGFTVPELLVVATLMILLAVIAIPILSSQRAKVDQGELKSDLVNASMNIDQAKVDNGGKYPTALPSDIKLTSSNAELRYTYPYDRLEYCLQIIAGETTLFKSSKSSEITTTDCTYEFVVPSTKLTGRMKGFDPVLSWNTVANATSYVIYKNNIPVKTVTFAVGSTAKSASYTLPKMNPLEEGVFHVVVADGGNQSAQSNSVRLKAPIPTPTKPEIKLVSKDVKDSTTMSFNIGWTAVKYAKNYELYDVTGATPTKIETLSESAGSYKYESPRGTIRKVILRSVNEAGVSGDSNILTLSSEWDAAKIISATSDAATGKISFVFHEDNDGKITPDYGWPTSSIRLKIIEVPTGSVVLDVSGVKTMTYTNAKSFNRVQHRATIVATTSTGEVLSESAPITIDFPKPTTPAVPTNFTSTNGGDADITPNRLKWTTVVCSPSSTPEYSVEHDGFNSGWIAGTSFNIPANWLAEGSQETFKIKARCVNANGTSGESGQASTTFTTGLSTPATPANLTVADRGSVASWDSVTCVTGSTAEYGVTQNIRNNDNTAYSFSPIKTSSYTFPSLIGGADQNFSVAARCVQYDGLGAVKASSSWSPYSGFYEWQTKFKAPVTPVLAEVSKSYTSSTNAEYRIRWNADQWARSYELFDASNNRSLGVIDGGVLETVVNGTRGRTLSVYLVASNPDFTSAKSSTLALKDVWPAATFLETNADPYSGFITVKMQSEDANGKRTPDWGTPDSTFEISLVDTVTGNVHAYDNITTSTFTTPDELDRNPHEATVVVKTATGVRLTPVKKTITFLPPGAPSAPKNIRTGSSGDAIERPNQLIWDAVTCGPANVEYLVNDLNDGNSEWIRIPAVNGATTFNIPTAWLQQGYTENFTVAARCTNLAGESPSSAATPTSFRVNINTPDALEGIKNNKVDTVSWSHADALIGLSREYLVTTRTFNGVASTSTYTTQNSSFLVANLAPNKNQIVDVQVRFFNPTTNFSSAWSPKVNTSWITPKPIPGVPEITLNSSTVLNATTQRYVISWAATTWAEGYRVVNTDTGAIMATVTGTTATLDLKRGIDETTVYVEAFNTSATSDTSNEIGLYAPWEDPELKVVTPNRDGTVELAWQEGTLAAPTPDWGTPGYKVNVEIRSGSTSGTVVYSAANLTTLGQTTTAFASTQSLRNLTYFAKITVVTSTGVTLNSAWQTIKFEKPITPARVKNVRSDDGGTGIVKNDRILWDTVICSQPNTEPQYWAAAVPPGTNYASSAGTRVVLMSWTTNVTSRAIAQSQLVGIQGENYAVIVMSRCVFTDSGDASSYYDPIVEGDGYHEYTVGIAPPTKNPGTPTRVNTFNNTISWTAATCGVGTTPEYNLNQTIKNGVTVSTVMNLDETFYAVPGVTAGTNQAFQVQARCVKDTDATKMSSYGNYSASYGYRAPLPKPVAPAIKEGALVYTTATAATQTITWVAVANAENYVVYDGTTVIATLPAATRLYTVPLVRGSVAAKNITVKATNFMYAAAAVTASNKVTISAPWPDVEIESIVSNQTRQFTVAWQSGTGTTRSPNWGDNLSKVTVVIRNAANTADVYKKTLLTTNDHLTTAMPGTDSQFKAYIQVTTANGEVLTSPTIAATLNPPAKPAIPTNFKTVTGSGPITPSSLSWTAVTCPTSGSTAEYYVTHTDAEFGNKGSGWFASSTATYNVSQSWLQAGRVQTFAVEARCVSNSGDSLSSGKVTINSARTNVPIPDKIVNFTLDANNSDGTASVSWDAISCPSHLNAGYAIQWVKKNSLANVSLIAAYEETNLTITGLTRGEDHTATVVGRCYDPLNTGITSTWANATPSAAISWTSPIPAPARPTLTVSAIKTNAADEKKTQGTLTWNIPTYTAKTYVYTSTGTLLGTYTTGTTSLIVNTTRGTSTNYYVVSENAQGVRSANSIAVRVFSTWPALTLTQTGYNSVTGAWAAKWATAAQNPDWGTGATFQLYIKNAAGTNAFNDVGLPYTTTTTYKTLPFGASTYTMTAVVTTTTGVKLSDTITVDHVTTPSEPANFVSSSHTGVKWSAVSCPSGSVANYQVAWTKKNGLASTTVYNTTSVSQALAGITPNTAQTVTVRAKCASADYGDSAWSGYSTTSFTSFYAIPTTVPKPSSVTMNSSGTNTTSDKNRISWTHIVCPTGSTRTYTVTWNFKDGKKYDEAPHNRTTPFNTYTGITTNYYNLSTAHQQQGSRRSWSVEAVCTVTLGSKGSGSVATGWHTSSIDAPSGTLAATNNGWMTYSWNFLTCPAGTKEKNRLHVYFKNGVDIANYYTPYFDDYDNSRFLGTDIPDAKYGATHGIHVYSTCQFANLDGITSISDEVSSNAMRWTPKVGTPVIESFVGSKANRNATFKATCAYGTNFNYVWTIQNSAGTYIESKIDSYKEVNTASGNPTSVAQYWFATTAAKFNIDSYCQGVNARSAEKLSKNEPLPYPYLVK